MDELLHHPLLHKNLLNNSVLEWLLALGTFLGVWLALIVTKKYVLARVQKLAAHTYSRLRDIVNVTIGGVHPSFFPLMALQVAIQRLQLHSKFEKAVDAVVLAVIIIQVAIIVARVASYFIMRASFGRDANDLSVRSVRLNLKAIAVFSIWVAAFLFFLSNLGVNITTFVTGLGIGGIAVALAAQNILGDVFSSFTIALDKPFEIGDYIAVDPFMGTVEHIGLKTTRIRSLSGELLVFPNSDLTKARIKNYKKMVRRRAVFKLGVTYDTPLEALKEIPALAKAAVLRNEKTTFDRAHFLTFSDSSMDIEVVYFVEAPDFNTYADIQQRINLELTEEFRKRGINFAFPSQSVYVESLPKVTMTEVSSHPSS